MIKEGDVLIPTSLSIEVPTNAGRGKLYSVDNPYPFINKAVIVATNKVADDINVGDVVMIDNTFKPVVAVGSGDNAYIRVNAFVHPDVALELSEYPTDPENEHYGYFLIPNHLIKLSL